MSNRRQRLGRWGEEIAANHLVSTGYELMVRNYRCTEGEVDIIATQDGVWVFVEVKTRRGNLFGPPEEAITPTKAARMLRVAEEYLQAHQLTNVDWRVDVIAVELDEHGKLIRVEQIEQAVSGW